ncbi:hypothetical protein GUJ93_ZPchr0001g29640 [Zizania palustris]|uniref:Uncharacterized protein n=1 Tax=Zizania palustris TaxID=103762 RepID=A0A8J5V2Z9_ZIZPA|nr:hypothetical protein GUJ93_ZPchr0001g29640 [Zizania palustris]
MKMAAVRSRHRLHVDRAAEESRAPVQDGEQAHQVSYDVEITRYIKARCIKKLKGVKAKEFMLWMAVNEITVDHPPTGKIHLTSLAGVVWCGVVPHRLGSWARGAVHTKSSREGLEASERYGGPDYFVALMKTTLQRGAVN